MKSSKVLLNISAFVCYLYGAVYLFSLVFIPIGVYCFIAAKRFATKADHIDDFYSIDKKIFRNYVIFASIFCFPLGMLSIIPYILITGNNIKVKTAEDKSPNEDATMMKTETLESEPEKPTTSAEVAELSDEEKQEKFQKLQNFKEKGLITDDELEMAREQLFGKKEK